MAKKKAAKKKSRISEQTVKTHLKCKLSVEEVAEASENTARLVQEKAVQEADKKSAMAGFKARIDAAEAGIVSESNKVRDKYEYRDVECTVTRDYEKKTIKKVRSDTEETIEDRKMTLGEKNSESLL